MAKRTQWTPEMVQMLGNATDAAVAKAIGVSRSVVWIERERRGIMPFRMHDRLRVWTKDAVALLNNLPDQEVAERLGISVAAVLRRRSREAVWSLEDIEKLGKDSDRQIARRLGISDGTVRKKRRALGITPAIVWGDEQVALLGVLPDKAVAEALGTTTERAAAARLYRGIPPMEEEAQEAPPKPVKLGRPQGEDWSNDVMTQLGKVPDSRIAKEAGVHLSTVAKLRKKYGIKATKQRRPWLPEEVALLGTLSDAEVARRIGRTKAGVTLERTNRRIRGIDPKLAPTLNRLAKEGKI